MPKDWKVSPRYDMKSLRDGKVQPIDVFEDAIQGWILDYASRLVALKEDHAGMAVMVLVAAYPETIECYSTGIDSKNNSRRFFANGMRRVFPELKEQVSDEALNSIYDDLRNGLYHTGMLKGSLVLTPTGKAIDYSSEDQLFRVNPFEFFNRVKEHFTAYVARVRVAPSDELTKFLKFWNARHAIAEGDGTAARPVTPDATETATSTAAPRNPSQSLREM